MKQAGRACHQEVQSATAGRRAELGPPHVHVYHLGQNNYSFDALQAYCFGINLKL